MDAKELRETGGMNAWRRLGHFLMATTIAVVTAFLLLLLVGIVFMLLDPNAHLADDSYWPPSSN
jgi:hypothetical protein